MKKDYLKIYFSNCSKEELNDMLSKIDYKLNEINEHGLGDSSSEKEKLFLLKEKQDISDELGRR